MDDPDQPISIRDSWKRYWIALKMPTAGVNVNLYFSTKKGGVGVWLEVSGNLEERIFERLLEDREAIEKDLGIPVDWSVEDPEDETFWIESFKKFPDLKDTTYRPDIMEFFQDRTNLFINVFRHRIKQIAEDLVG